METENRCLVNRFIKIFPGILADQPKIAIGVAVGVGLASAVGLFALYYRNKLLNTPPKK